MQEIQMAKDHSQELINKILRRSRVILDGLLRVTASPNRDRLKDVEGKLNDYNVYEVLLHASSWTSLNFDPLCSLLGKILVVLKANTSKSKIHRLINRTSRLSDLQMYDRLIDDFNMDFLVCFHLQFNCSSSSQL